MLLTGGDLGRHIINGRVILETGKVFSTNFYSYTATDKFAPNHHWLFGVIVESIHRYLGFEGLTVLSVILYTAAISLVLFYVAKKFGTATMFIAGLIVLSAITDRTEVRPEAFSLFFFALLIVVLLRWYERKISTNVTAVILFFTALFWVNIHIFFFLQFLVLGVFGIQSLVNRDWKKVKELIFLATISLVAVCINPLGLKGVIYPFQILGDYGYSVGENKSPYFFLVYYRRFYNIYLIGLFVLALISGIHTGWKFKKKYIAVLLLGLTLLVFANKLIRFSNFFGLVSCIVLAISSQSIITEYRKKAKNFLDNTIYLSITSLIGFAVLVVFFTSGLFFPNRYSFGLGLHDRILNSAEFFKKLTVTGPIFNNFDIGGYLIYNLYPQKVYIDNRPEAYSESFLKEYVDIQINKEHWKEIDDHYKFGAIYFSMRFNI
jgi:hypothetical protein